MTDKAINLLAKRAGTLERVHLSYCDKISWEAIAALIVRLRRLTYLSLTDIPSVQPHLWHLRELSLPPPPDLNQNQRAVFCVLSGKGMLDARAYATGKSPAEQLRAAGATVWVPISHQ